MKGSVLGLAAVVIVAAGIVTAKHLRTSRTPEATSAHAMVSATSSKGPQVILVADPREAGEACGCGAIFHLVREAHQRGVAVREIAPSDTAVTRRYGVTVAPTVLILDAGGRVSERYIGEDDAAVAAIRAELLRLESAHAPTR